MDRTMARLAAALLLVSLAGPALSADLPPVVRGNHTVILRLDPGPVTVTVSKRDLNIYPNLDPVRFTIFDSQRRIVGQADLPDDGNAPGVPAPLQEAVIEGVCHGPGTWRLVVDGPSGDFVFGVRLSSGAYMVEGDMLLNDGKIGGDLLFSPPVGAFTIQAQALHEPGRQQMPLIDGAGNVLYTFDLVKTGDNREFRVEADTGDRNRPWRFRIEKMDVKLNVPGVTLWNCDEKGFFQVEKHRWMLFPYSETRCLQPGQEVDVRFTLRNQTGAPDEFALTAASDDGLSLGIVAPESPVRVDGQRYRNSAEITVRVRVPQDATAGAELGGVLTAASLSDPLIAETVGIRVLVGPPLVSRMLDGPVVLERYRHENYQFGYAPDYVTNEVYFDLTNRPWIRDRTSHRYTTTALTTLEGGEWVSRRFEEAVRGAVEGFRGFYMGGGFIGAKVAFDPDGGVYTPLLAMRTGQPHQPVLVYTPDRGVTFQAIPFEGGVPDIEQFTGHNAPDGPPTVLSYRQTKEHPATFCSYNDLLLYAPRKTGAGIEMGEPVLVSDKCLGACLHSGGPGSVATRDGKTHVVWGEVAPDDAPGVPTYIATFDRATGTLGEKVLLGYGPPVNDVHNVPAITLDSKGYIHVMTGAHGANFTYRRSLAPNDAYSGWTEPVNVLDAGYVDDKSDADGAGRQTYISLVCGPDDTLYTAYRQWRQGVDQYHGGNIYAALSFQSKPPDGPWGPAQPRVIPAVDGYSIYYHKLTVDRKGNLYLSYSYYTSDLTYQNEYPEHYHNCAIQVSRDKGATWKLAETSDFAAGVAD